MWFGDLKEEDYAAWRKLKSLTEEIKSMQKKKDEPLSLIEIAKKKCWPASYVHGTSIGEPLCRFTGHLAAC